MFNFKQIYVSLHKRSRKTSEKERYRAIVNHTGTDKKEKNLCSSEHNSKMNRRKLFSK